MFEALVKTGTSKVKLCQVLWKPDLLKALVVVSTKSQVEQITWQLHKIKASVKPVTKGQALQSVAQDDSFESVVEHRTEFQVFSDCLAKSRVQGSV